MKQLIQQAPSVSGIIVPPGASRRPDRARAYLVAAVLLLLAVALGWYFLRPQPAAQITTETLVRKTLVDAVTATIFFGYCPALKASRLNPIDALRFE